MKYQSDNLLLNAFLDLDLTVVGLNFPQGAFEDDMCKEFAYVHTCCVLMDHAIVAGDFNCTLDRSDT